MYVSLTLLEKHSIFDTNLQSRITNCANSCFLRDLSLSKIHDPGADPYVHERRGKSMVIFLSRDSLLNLTSLNEGLRVLSD